MATPRPQIRESWLRIAVAAALGTGAVLALLSVLVVSAASLGKIEAESLKENPLTTQAAPTQVRDQFKNSGTLNNQPLQFDGGSDWTERGAPSWSNASAWSVTSGAASRTSGTGLSFARFPWINNSNWVSATVGSVSGTADWNIQYGVAMIGSNSQNDALVGVIGRDSATQEIKVSVATISQKDGKLVHRGPAVVVAKDAASVPKGSLLLLEYDVNTRVANASFLGKSSTWNLTTSGQDFAEGSYAGLVANGSDKGYTFASFNAGFNVDPPTPPEPTPTPTPTPTPAGPCTTNNSEIICTIEQVRKDAYWYEYKVILSTDSASELVWQVTVNVPEVAGGGKNVSSVWLNGCQAPTSTFDGSNLVMKGAEQWTQVPCIKVKKGSKAEIFFNGDPRK